MARPLLCDGCGIDLEFLDKLSLNFTSIDTGSFAVDLCMNCSDPIRQTEIFQRVLEERTARIEEEQRRRLEQEKIVRQAAATKVAKG